VRLTENGNTRSKQLLMMPTESCTNQQRMASRRAFEWIGTLKAQLFFRYEISDLLSLVYILEA